MHAVLSDPGGTVGQAIRAMPYSSAHRYCLPQLQKRQLPPRMSYFGAQSHGLPARCLRFALVVTDAHARLASGWWPTLAGRGLDPLGSIAKFPRLLHRFPLTQALPGAL